MSLSVEECIDGRIKMVCKQLRADKTIPFPVYEGMKDKMITKLQNLPNHAFVDWYENISLQLPLEIKKNHWLDYSLCTNTSITAADEKSST